MAEVEAVLFDLDLTLVRMDMAVRDKLVGRICRDLANRHGLDESALFDLQHAVTLPRWLEFQDTLLASPATAPDGLTIMRSIWRDALNGCGCDDEVIVSEAFDLYWQGRAGIVTPYDEVAEVLESLSRRLPLAVITNGPSITQLDKLEVLGLDHHFRVFIASGDAGVEKPNPAIFQLALDKLGVEPVSAWHVGDSLSADVGGAIGAGLKAAWLNRTGDVRPPEQPEPHAELTSLRELLPLLSLADD